MQNKVFFFKLGYPNWVQKISKILELGLASLGCPSVSAIHAQLHTPQVVRKGEGIFCVNSMMRNYEIFIIRRGSTPRYAKAGWFWGGSS